MLGLAFGTFMLVLAFINPQDAKAKTTAVSGSISKKGKFVPPHFRHDNDSVPTWSDKPKRKSRKK